MTSLRKAMDGEGILEQVEFDSYADRIEQVAEDASPAGGSGRIAKEFKSSGIRSLEGNWRSRIVASMFKGNPTVTVTLTHALLLLRGDKKDRGEVVFRSLDQGYASATIRFDHNARFPFRLDASGKAAKGSPWAFVPEGVQLSRSGGPGFHMTDKAAQYVRTVVIPSMRTKIQKVAKRKFD